MKAPILAHVASRDEWVTPARAKEIHEKITAHGGSMRLEVYEADHAFVRDTDPRSTRARGSQARLGAHARVPPPAPR